MRLAAVSVIVFATLFGSIARSAEVPPPTVELRIQSVNQLLPTFEYVAGIFNQAEAGKQGVEFLKTLTDDKTGIDGIDPARPFGMSIALTKDVVDSPVIVMLPLADEAAFLDLLRDKLDLDPKKTKDVYEVEVPNVPAPVFFRFTQGYVVATVQNAGNLNDAKFLPVKEFFAVKPQGIADLRVHLDRVPEDVTKVVLAQLELKLQDELAKPMDGETVGQKKLRLWVGERLTEVVPMLLKQGKLLSLTLNADAKSDALTTDVRFSAKDGTALADILAALDGRSGLPLVSDADALNVLALNAKLALPTQARESFEPVLEALLKDFVEQAKESERGFLIVALDAIKPTIQAGELDMSAALVDAADGKSSTVALSMKLVKGLEIEKLLKLFGPFLPSKQGKFTLNADKVDGNAIHKLELNDDRLKTLYGTNAIWLSVRDDRLTLTVEPDGSRIKAILAAKPNAAAAPLTLRATASRLPKYFDSKLDAKLLDVVRTEVFGDGKKATGDTMEVSLTGGKELRLKLTTQGKAVKFLAVLDQESKK